MWFIFTILMKFLQRYNSSISHGLLHISLDKELRETLERTLIQRVAWLQDNESMDVFLALDVVRSLISETLDVRYRRRFLNSIRGPGEAQHYLEMFSLQYRTGRAVHPPIGPLPFMTPILSPEAVIEEGLIQDNCLRTLRYWALVVEGSYALYSLFKPERATIAIRKQNDQWHLDQLYKRANQPVDAGLSRKILDWLKQSQNENSDQMARNHG
jgi:hypothetical protein